MNNLIAYCGLNCENCDARKATINNDDELRKKTAKLWSELNNFEILPEMINCEGCRVGNKKTYYCEAMCEIRKCAIKKTYNTCADCSTVNDCKMISAVLENNSEAKKNLIK